MAITIQNAPGEYYSVHGDLLFVVVDIVKANDPVTYPDYRYIADIYVGAEMVARLKAYPNPENKMGIFNIGTIIRNYIEVNLNPPADTFATQTFASGDFYINATVKFGEEYDFTLYTNLTEDSERTYYNHYNGRLLGQNTSLADYVNRVASIRPVITPVYSNAAFTFLNYFFDGDPKLTTLSSYTKSGTLQAIHAGVLGPSSVHDLRLLNVSPQTLNIIHPNFITGSTGYYIVGIEGELKAYQFNLVCESQYEVFTLHFLNRFGGFESRDFTKVSRKTIDIEKQEFGKLGYVLDSSGVVSYYNSNKVYHETRSVYSSQFKEKMILNTDILNDEEYRWLGDLILSPMIYIEMEGYFIPCSITEKNYEFKKTINDKLTNLTISIEFGEQFNAQYR